MRKHQLDRHGLSTCKPDVNRSRAAIHSRAADETRHSRVRQREHLAVVLPRRRRFDGLHCRDPLASGRSGIAHHDVNNLPNTDPIIGGAIRVASINMTVLGTVDQGTPAAGDDKPFLTNPTRCDAWVSKVYSRAYKSNGNADVDLDPAIAGNDYVTGTSSLASPNCGALNPFARIPITQRTNAAGTPTTLTANLTNSVPLTVGSFQPASVKRLDLTFPLGYQINPAIDKIGASGCSDLQFDIDHPDITPACLASTEIGTTSITTPLLAHAMTGKPKQDLTVKQAARTFDALSPNSICMSPTWPPKSIW